MGRSRGPRHREATPARGLIRYAFFFALFSHGDNTPSRQVMVARRVGRADFKLGSWTMVIILIRRFVKPDKETEFLENYRAQQPLNNPAFIGETLTRLVDSSSLPGGLRSFA